MMPRSVATLTTFSGVGRELDVGEYGAARGRRRAELVDADDQAAPPEAIPTWI
jgi:hypothetical protein